MKAIADTGFVVAFANRRDIHHEWAVALASQTKEPFLTCEPVLSESAFHLEDSGLVLDLVQEGLLAISFDARRHLKELNALARRFSDRKPDLADLCLIRMSELYPRHAVLTVDVRDFTIYRRNGRESIPLVTPRG